MGFVSSTRKRRIKEPKRDRKGESGDCKRRKKSSSKGKKSSSPSPSLSLEHLPIEILQRIFIHSRNPALLECSKYLYYTLSGSSWLHSEIVRASSEEVEDGRRLDIRVCGLKFITVDLLKNNNIDTFVDPESEPSSDNFESPLSAAPEESSTDAHAEPDPDVELEQILALTEEEATAGQLLTTDSEIVNNEQEEPSEEAPVEEKGPLLPEALELPPFSQRKIDVINYMLEKKCQSRDGSKVVEHAVQNNNEQLVQRLVTAGLSFDHKAVVLALEQGYFNIAHTLLSSTVFSADDESLWDHVTKSRNITTFNFLRQYGSPPYHLLT
uniref:ARAD1C30998p n=1 Tax=Blastobotrys adeninivorans TaxID=409370 RepID=A0A060T2E5_BLAAD